MTALLGIQHLVLCVNKMGLVGWSEARFLEIVAEFRELAATLDVTVSVLPMAAASGKNIVDRGESMPWYEGPTLLEFLETVEVSDPARHAALRFPVQYVVRPLKGEFHDYRGYAGTVAAGDVRVGAEVTVLPIGARTTVTGVDRYFESCHGAASGEAVIVRLADDLDVGRGYMLVGASDPAPVTTRFTADLCWMNDASALRPGQQFWLKHTTRRVKCIVQAIDDRLEVASYERVLSPEQWC